MRLPGFLIVITVTFVPDSPRWLTAQGRDGEAIEVLAKVRGDVPINDPTLLEEVEVLRAQVESAKHKRNSLINMATGRYSGRLTFHSDRISQCPRSTPTTTIGSRLDRTLTTLSNFSHFKSLKLLIKYHGTN